MKKQPFLPRTAFTLVELLVSMAVLVIIMIVLLSITGATQRIWQQTSQRIDSFRSARNGFESMTRCISQATLNPYWDYDSTTAPTKYVLNSELRFISGKQNAGTSLMTNQFPDTATIKHPTHSIFFQAPLGYISTSASTSGTYNGMENLLNTCGYFIELASDTDVTLANTQRPPFLTLPARTRFRLMELCQPSDVLNIYTLTPGNPTYGSANNGSQYAWFLGAPSTVTSLENNSHVIAENVIALIFVPKLSAADETAATGISPPLGTYLLTLQLGQYFSMYNSAPTAWPPVSTQLSANKLPPLVQVTMVAIDETSAARLQILSTAQGTDQATLLGLASTALFTKAGSLTDNTQPGYAKDLLTLTGTLQALHLSYRVFTSEVSIRAAKFGSK